MSSQLRVSEEVSEELSGRIWPRPRRLPVGGGWIHITAGVPGMTIVLATAAVLILSAAAARAQSCSDIDEQCTMPDTGMCQADGSCAGTPVTDGTSCNDFNPCTSNDHCQSGHCVGSTLPDTSSCSFGFSNPCFSDGQCLAGVCIPTSFVQCPPSGNACAPNVCNPLTGQCGTITITCADSCDTGQCDPATGCVSKPDNTSCDDGNVCTSNDRCQSGVCSGGGAAVPTNTPPPTSAMHSPTPTPTQTSAPSATAPPTIGVCVGDCDSNGVVDVDELAQGLSIGLGQVELTNCGAFDLNGDQKVTVDELAQGVRSAVNGCIQAPTPTATVGGTQMATATPTATHVPTPTGTTGVGTTPTATPMTTGPSVASRAAGTVESSSVALLAIPNALSALLSQVSQLSGGAASLVTIPFTCPVSGNGTLSCDQTISIGIPPVFGPPTFTATLNNCVVGGGAGTQLTFNGTVQIMGQDGDLCAQIPTSAGIQFPSLTIESKGAAGTTTATLTNVKGSIDLFCSQDQCQCSYDTVDLGLTGSIAIVAKDSVGTTVSSTQATFQDGSSILIGVSQYGDQCVPTIYEMTVDGGVNFLTDGNSLDATLVGYTMDDDATSGTNMIDVFGTVLSDCFGLGGAVDLSTTTTLSVPGGVVCPTAGAVQASSGDSVDLITYTSGGGVQVDLGNDGTVDNSYDKCTDPRLFQCVGSS
jgi:hypothetical protein